MRSRDFRVAAPTVGRIRQAPRLQLPYSVAGRDPERELLPTAAAFGLTVTPRGACWPGEHVWEPPAIAPIVGARTVEQLAANLGALDVDLSPDHLERLETVGRPDLGFPRNFLESRGVRELIYGDLA